jgi:DNA modification methylase
MGIGSTGVVALQLERKFTGIELKGEYFNTSMDNLLLVKPTTTMKDFLKQDNLDEGLLRFSK